MSLIKLKTHILEAAEREAAAIRADWVGKREAQQARIRRQASALEGAIIDAANSEAGDKERRLYQQAQLASRAHVLRAKQDELMITKEAVRQAILAFDAKQTKALLRALHKYLPSKDGGTIVPGEIHASFIREIGKDYKVLETPIAGEGGFIYRDRHTEINLTISHLVTQLMTAHRAEMAALLFS